MPTDVCPVPLLTVSVPVGMPFSFGEEMSGNRKSISKKTRFEVFKRDGFSCMYCGNTPPAVVLEVDHIIPVSAGGENSLENYVTSCFECNRGKGARELTEVPPPLEQKIAEMAEKEDQIKAFKNFLAAVKRRKTREINKIEAIFTETFPDRVFTASFKRGSVGMFLDKLPYHEVEDAMFLAVDRVNDPPNAAKYFCGVCWHKVKGDQRS